MKSSEIKKRLLDGQLIFLEWYDYHEGMYSVHFYLNQTLYKFFISKKHLKTRLFYKDPTPMKQNIDEFCDIVSSGYWKSDYHTKIVKGKLSEKRYFEVKDFLSKHILESI